MTELVKTQEQIHANHLFQQAKVLSNTEVVPQHLRGKPEQVYAIILAGDDLGISPTAALQSFASINGKLTMSAELMRALILGAGHSLSFPESTTESCTIVGRRKDTGDTATVTYTKEDAERAGLWGSHTWKKYPRQLLSARATTELARLLFPDLIKGISYTEEELGAVYSEDQEPRFTVENATIEGETIEEPETEEVEVLPEEEPSITQKQMRLIMATKTGWTKNNPELADQLEAWYELKHGDKSHKELTKQDASEYIEYIKYLEEAN